MVGLCMLILVAAASDARADVLPFFRKPGPPKPPPPPPAFPAEPFTIELLGENEGVQPVLQITPNFYKSLRKIAMVDVPNDRSVVEAPVPETPRFRLAVAGVALTLAFGAGGLWLRRSGGTRLMKLVVLLGVTGTLGGAAIMAMPQPKPKPDPEMKANPGRPPIENQLRVELHDQKSDAVRIRISRAYLEKLLEANKPAPAPKPKEKDNGPVLPPPPTEFPKR
jgi:hypothetical protein